MVDIQPSHSQHEQGCNTWYVVNNGNHQVSDVLLYNQQTDKNHNLDKQCQSIKITINIIIRQLAHFEPTPGCKITPDHEHHYARSIKLKSKNAPKKKK